MKVRKDVAVAICQEYGFRMADGWPDSKLARKVGELVESFRSGEFDVKDEALAKELDRLAEADDDVVEIVSCDDQALDDEKGGAKRQDVDEEESAEEWEEEDVASGCALKVGDRVLVHDGTEDKPWPGVVTQVFSKELVEVRDKKGKVWDVKADECEVETKRSDSAEEEPMRKEETGSVQDDVEAEIVELKKRIQELKQRRKAKMIANRRKRKLRRDEIAAMVLRKHPDGGAISQLGKEVEEEYVGQGRNPCLKRSVAAVRKVARVGALLGLFEIRDGELVVPLDKS